MTGAVWTSQEFSLGTISHALQAPASEKTVLHSPQLSSAIPFCSGYFKRRDAEFRSLPSALLFCMIAELSLN